MSLSRINKVLIANRGEIACRVIKTAKRMGIETVAVYSEPDKNSLHVSMANEAYCIGPAASQQSYLRGDKILNIAEKSKSQAIHPGYGFLSENVEFAALCKQRNVIFIGPPEDAIRDMGIKNTSKKIMEEAGVPVVKGYHGNEQNKEFLLKEAQKIGFPIMIKAVRGGGGKGMRIAMNEEIFYEQLESAKREALKSFNDDAMLLEKFIETPRHVEVQIFGDHHGNYLHLCERDCSVQRRHQKIIEEAPGPGISPELRNKLGSAAVKAAAAVKYVGAGTVEFIMDKNGEFFFMEMNTRLQVEHPVTEMITRQDLVEWQLRVASGEPLPITDQAILSKPYGHAFEARIYAEDCSPTEFLPTAGQIKLLRPPLTSETIRIDTGVSEGDHISVHYDPMISKLIVWSSDRTSALSKLTKTLQSYHILGLPTNIQFLKQLANHPEFQAGHVHTDFIKQHQNTLFPQNQLNIPLKTIAVTSLAFIIRNIKSPIKNHVTNEDLYSPFINIANFRINHNFKKDLILIDKANLKNEININLEHIKNTNKYNIKIKNQTESIQIELLSENDDDNKLRVCINDEEICDYWIYNNENSDELYVVDNTGCRYEFIEKSFKNGIVLGELEDLTSGGNISDRAIAPMPGVIERIMVEKGQKVEIGQILLTLVAMKMEYSVRASCVATVTDILTQEGSNVAKNQLLIKLEPSEN